jgi:uncharacterized protein with PQ loop repeat
LKYEIILIFIVTLLLGVSFVPQIITSLKNKKTGNISLIMMCFLFFQCSFFIKYNIIADRTLLIIPFSILSISAFILVVIKAYSESEPLYALSGLIFFTAFLFPFNAPLTEGIGLFFGSIRVIPQLYNNFSSKNFIHPFPFYCHFLAATIGLFYEIYFTSISYSHTIFYSMVIITNSIQILLSHLFRNSSAKRSL